MSDKRAVSTDALTTLGTCELGNNPGRDAIHLAVEPVEANETLLPGDHIGIVNGRATKNAKKLLGIVDPFLKGMVMEGDVFWLIVYPRTITSLRHVWEHPDFTAEAKAKSEKNDSESIIWIKDFAENCIGTTYEELIAGAKEYVDTGEYMHMGDNESYNSYYDEMPEFWKHFQIVTGIDPANRTDEGESFFSCSC